MFAHEPGAFSDGHNKQGMLEEEARWERDMQDTLMTPLETQNPTHPGGILSGHATAWTALTGLTALGLRCCRSTSHAMVTKNEEKN